MSQFPPKGTWPVPRHGKRATRNLPCPTVRESTALPASERLCGSIGHMASHEESRLGPPWPLHRGSPALHSQLVWSMDAMKGPALLPKGLLCIYETL